MLNVYLLTPIMILLEMEWPENQMERQLMIETSLQKTQDHMPLPHHQTDIQMLPQVHSDSDDNDHRFVHTKNMLYTIDEGVPDLDNVISIDNGDLTNEVRLAEITLKTAPPLNLERERRMEELC
ncbi:unnamed protein product [Psylliodes chrysocephalus]|uniref:Uncharacterized protein n=1 Tax=Psylliodes chrysocephalus TaxID=3402493 RepID=A0A9P0CNG8_9CUCU|nr:unnamed protein product [Psylliodes chrysocephala]